jgi:solute carrier family 25 phosphate transporter 3
MPLLFPTQGNVYDVFHPAVPFGRQPETPNAQPTATASKRTPLQARSDLYTTWSVVDYAKDKANALSAEATKEYEKASAKAQAKTGHIEMYSSKYFTACTFGGLVACVSTLLKGFLGNMLCCRMCIMI